MLSPADASAPRIFDILSAMLPPDSGASRKRGARTVSCSHLQERRIAREGDEVDLLPRIAVGVGPALGVPVRRTRGWRVPRELGDVAQPGDPLDDQPRVEVAR